MQSEEIYIGCDMSIGLTGVRSDGSYLNAATITWDLRDEGGSSLGTGSFTYQTASNGNYKAVVESTITTNLTEYARYHLFVYTNQGNYDDTRRLTCVAKYRTRR